MSILRPSTTAIIFDIGNVIIDIDYEAVATAFRQIAVVDFSPIVSYKHQAYFFDQFEKGEITVAAFRTALRPYLKPTTTDAEIDHAWNAIFTAFPTVKFEWLLSLKSQYRTFALSNINEIHLTFIDDYLRQQFCTRLCDYFHHAYYSHEMGYRKPEPEIYELLLQQEQLKPSSCLFIDDKAENIAAAAQLGLQVLHLADGDSLLSYF